MSLARFTSQPRKGHLEGALYTFGYLKKRPNRRFVIDSSDPTYQNCEEEFAKDLVSEFAEYYPGASEEIDRKLPGGLFDELAINVFVDSDHAHDKLTRRSVTGILIMIGRTPVYTFSKRQGAIETSTFGAEMTAFKTAIEEVIEIRYMLRCLGVKVTKPTKVFGDNKGMIQNVSIKDSLLKKKHVAIAYHKSREATAAGIAHPIHCPGDYNYSDVLTKPVTRKTHKFLVGSIPHS